MLYQWKIRVELLSKENIPSAFISRTFLSLSRVPGPVLRPGTQAVNHTSVQAVVTSNVTCGQVQSNLSPMATVGAFSV